MDLSWSVQRQFTLLFPNALISCRSRVVFVVMLGLGIFSVMLGHNVNAFIEVQPSGLPNPSDTEEFDIRLTQLG
jgi:hypothetical protein